jgi:hypothetical protein
MCRSIHATRLALAIPMIASLTVLTLPASYGDEPTASPASTPDRRIVLRITEEVFAPLMEREIDRTSPVREWMLGNLVTGQARTLGRPRVELIDDPNFAAFLVTIDGTTNSRGVSQSGPAIIHGGSETTFTATKRVVFAPGIGFFAEPAKIDARTRTFTQSVQSTRPLIRGMVDRRARGEIAARRPQITQQARRSAERRITAAFDNFLAKHLARLNNIVAWRDRIAAIRGRDGQPLVTCSSHSGYLEIVASFNDEAPREREFVTLPELAADPAPVQIWVHQSLLGDGLKDVLGGLVDRKLSYPTVLDDIFAGQVGTAAELQAQQFQAGLGDPPSEPLPVSFTTAEDWYIVQVDTNARPAAKK